MDSPENNEDEFAYLPEYQKNSLNSLYSYLVNSKKTKTYFEGPRGCGKSYIANKLAEKIVDESQEKWKIYILKGEKEHMTPYLEWCPEPSSLTQLKKKIDSFSIRLGVSYNPSPLYNVDPYIEFKYSSTNVFLNSNEHSIVNCVKKELGKIENILFIADNYEDWSQESLNLLEKILNLQEDILGNGKKVHAIFITQKDYSKSISGTPIVKIDPEDIKQGEIINLIKKFPNGNFICEEKIGKISKLLGNNLTLIKSALVFLERLDESFEYELPGNPLQSLFEQRIGFISKANKEACEMLEYVSIIENNFSENEASYLTKKTQPKAEEILNNFPCTDFIKKEHQYSFYDKYVQSFFQNRLKHKKKYIHHHFEKYLQEHYPEKYYNRACHLTWSEDGYNYSNIMNGKYLYAIYLARYMEMTWNFETIKNNVSSLQLDNDATLNEIAQKNIEKYLTGYELLLKCEYKEALKEFQSVNCIFSSLTFSIEIKRLVLLCDIMIGADIKSIRKNSEDLYNKIMNPQLHEDELWCLSSLLLIDVYGDHFSDKTKLSEIMEGFENRMRKHMNKSVFRNIYARYASRSALYYNANLASILTEESYNYYKKINSRSNQYFSLCNNAANLIICGDYETAGDRLDLCNKIKKTVILPSGYKSENNIILCDFLKKEKLYLNNSINREDLLSAAKEAANAFEHLKNTKIPDISHVIDFNSISMHLFHGDIKKGKNELDHFRKIYDQINSYYQYYYLNNCISLEIIEGNFKNAKFHIKKLKELKVLLLEKFSTILEKRITALSILIENNFSGDVMTLDCEIRKMVLPSQDSSANFWARAFLLSDLQYLSL